MNDEWGPWRLPHLHLNTNALTNTWATYRDGIGRAVQTTDPLGNATKLTWDNVFGVNSVADPMGHTASVVYDAVGNITQRTDPNQNVTKYTWDCRNRFKTHTDPLTNADSTSSGRTVPSTCATGGLGNYDGNSDLLGWVDRNHQSSGTQIAYTWDDFARCRVRFSEKRGQSEFPLTPHRN